MPANLITDAVKAWANDRVKRFNETVIVDPEAGYVARYRRSHLYLDRLKFGNAFPVARLTYTGDLDAWEFAIYKFSNAKYDVSEWLFPGSQHVDGTIEGAMRASLEAYP